MDRVLPAPQPHPRDPFEAELGAEAIRVLIAYADKLARAGLHALLDVEQGISVTGSAADGHEAIALARQTRPDPDPGLPGPEELGELTPREREVMALVAAGLSNEQIAEHLRDRAGAAQAAHRDGIRRPGRDSRCRLASPAASRGVVAPREWPTLGLVHELTVFSLGALLALPR